MPERQRPIGHRLQWPDHRVVCCEGDRASSLRWSPATGPIGTPASTIKPSTPPTTPTMSRKSTIKDGPANRTAAAASLTSPPPAFRQQMRQRQPGRARRRIQRIERRFRGRRPFNQDPGSTRSRRGRRQPAAGYPPPPPGDVQGAQILPGRRDEQACEDHRHPVWRSARN